MMKLYSLFILSQVILSSFSPLFSFFSLILILIIYAYFYKITYKTICLLCFTTIFIWYCMWHLSTMHLSKNIIVGGMFIKDAELLLLSHYETLIFPSFIFQFLYINNIIADFFGVTINLSNFNIFLLFKWILKLLKL